MRQYILSAAPTKPKASKVKLILFLSRLGIPVLRAMVHSLTAAVGKHGRLSVLLFSLQH